MEDTASLVKDVRSPEVAGALLTEEDLSVMVDEIISVTLNIAVSLTTSDIMIVSIVTEGATYELVPVSVTGEAVADDSFSEGIVSIAEESDSDRLEGKTDSLMAGSEMIADSEMVAEPEMIADSEMVAGSPAVDDTTTYEELKEVSKLSELEVKVDIGSSDDEPVDVSEELDASDCVTESLVVEEARGSSTVDDAKDSPAVADDENSTSVDEMVGSWVVDAIIDEEAVSVDEAPLFDDSEKGLELSEGTSMEEAMEDKVVDDIETIDEDVAIEEADEVCSSLDEAEDKPADDDALLHFPKRDWQPSPTRQ
jgi:hypothetical protein